MYSQFMETGVVCTATSCTLWTLCVIMASCREQYDREQALDDFKTGIICYGIFASSVLYE